jgi:hypothetical protein
MRGGRWQSRAPIPLERTPKLVLNRKQMIIAPYWFVFLVGAVLFTVLIRNAENAIRPGAQRALAYAAIWGVIGAPSLVVGEGGAAFVPVLVALFRGGRYATDALLTMATVAAVVFIGALLWGSLRKRKRN